jgi:aminopeptidase N
MPPRKRSAWILFVLFLLAAIPAAAQHDSPSRKFFTDENSSYHWGRDRTFDLLHTRLEIVPDLERRSVSGTATVRLRPLAPGLERIHLDGAELTVERVFTKDGALEFTYDDAGIDIDLGRACGPGDEIEISVDYTASPRAGLYFVGPDEDYPDRPLQAWSQGETEFNRYWFPGYDYPNDMGTSEMIVIVPEGFFAVSNGELEERTENADGTVTFHWKESQPHVTYLIALAVGRFEVHEETVGDLPLLYVVEKGEGDKAERSFRKTPAVMRFYQDAIGVPFPYEKYAQVPVSQFIWGGMENASCTVMTDRTLHDARAEPDYPSHRLVAHELAHQWFGDLLTCSDWAHNWLNESFATYFASLFAEHEKGLDEFRYRMDGHRKSYMREDRDEYRRPIVTHYYSYPFQLFDSHAYPKGARVLHMVRYLLGDDLWWKAVNRYVEENRFRPVETNDFKQALEEVSGRDFDGFFHQWLYSGGHPEYEVAWEWEQPSRSVVLTVRQTQTVDDLTPLFDMPVRVGIYGEDRADTFTVRVHEAEQEFVFPSEVRPRMVLFDVGNWILKELDFEKSSRELRYQLANAEDVVARIRAARSLGRKAASTRNLDALEIALRDEPFHGVRAQVAATLGTLKGSRAKALLGRTLREDPSSTVRKTAAVALGRFEDDEEVFGWLASAVKGDDSYAVRARALEGLAEGKFEKAYGVLEDALDQESHNDVVRAAALEGFAALGATRAVGLCREWAEYGRPREARQAAVMSLAKLGKRLDDEGDREEIRDTLTRLLEREDDFVHTRAAVARALGELGDAEAISALERARQTNLERRYVAAVDEAIEKLRAPREKELRNLEEEIAELKKENEELRSRLSRLEDAIGAEEEEQLVGGGGPGATGESP